MLVKEKLLETLAGVGLSGKEARIYLMVLELKEALPSGIARLTGLKRSTVYLLLDKLADKGLLSAVKKNGHLFYSIKDPDMFIREEIERSKKIHSSLEELSLNLPQLLMRHGRSPEPVEASVFTGQEGLDGLQKSMKKYKNKFIRYDHLYNEIIICGDKLAIISWEDKVGVLIRSKTLAAVQKTLLEKARKNK